MPVPTVMFVAAYLITQANGVPVKPHHHVLNMRRQHSRSTSAARVETTSMSTSSPTSSALPTSDPSVMSSRHEFFPAMIVIIVCVCLAVTGGLTFALLRLYKKRAMSSAAGPYPADMSSLEKFGHNHPVSISKPAMAAQPVMTTVSRGTHTRFSPTLDSPKYSFLDMNDDSVANASCCAHHAREPSEKEDVFSLVDDGESAFSFDVRDYTDRHSLRQSDLSKPCVTHGEPGWAIHACEEPEDTSQTRMH